MRVPKKLGYIGNKETHTIHTHKLNNTQPHDKNTCVQQQQHPPKHTHATTTTTTNTHMQQQQQQQTHTYATTTTTTTTNPTPRTIIGHSPHPPTCVWVGWVFV